VDRVLAPVRPLAAHVGPAKLAIERAAPATEHRAKSSLVIKDAAHKPRQRLAMRPMANALRRRAEKHQPDAQPVVMVHKEQGGVACDRLGGMDLARCMRPQVVDADQQLRSAYQDAVRAGVDRHMLANYRRKWSKLRNQANSNPRGLVVGYHQITQQLDAARTGNLVGGF
jgi:hypothetical protein